MVTILIRGISRWYIVLGKTGCTQLASLAYYSLTATSEIFRHATSEYNLSREDRNLAEKPSKQCCYTLLNYWTGWESLLQISHSSYCCKRVPENKLVSLQTSHILWTWFRKNLSATSRVVCLTILCHVPEWQKKPPTTNGTNPQALTNHHSAYLTKHHRCFPALWSQPCPKYLWQETRTANKKLAFPEGICCYFDELARLTKKTSSEPKEERDYRSEEIFLQNTVGEEQSGPIDVNVSVICGEYEMKRVVILRPRKLSGTQSRGNWRRKFR